MKCWSMRNREKEYCVDLVKRLSKKRMQHVLSVVKEADRLAKFYAADVEKCRLAALLHDSAKELSLEEMQSLLEKDKIQDLRREDFLQGEILHGFVGARWAQKHFQIEDAEILEAIAYHTIGKKDLSLVAQIVYIADAIEEGRNYPGLDRIRRKVYENLSLGILEELRHKERYLQSIGAKMHPNTLEWKKSLEEMDERK